MALATELVAGEVILNGDIHGSVDPLAPELTPTGVAAGTYVVPTVVVDAKGRILYAQEEDLNIACATDTVCGIVKPGHHIDLAGDQISIAFASNSDYGVVKPSTGFSISAGVLSVDFPEATTTTDGAVTVPESGNIDIDGSGNISIPLATESVVGVMQVGTGLDVSAGVVSFDITDVTIPDATEISKGYMQVGTGLDVSAGVVSVDITETPLPDATEGSKGYMQVGTGLDVAGGIVSVNVSEITFPDASGAAKGFAQVGDNINVASGVISVSEATTGVKGIFKGDETSVFIDGTSTASVTTIASGATLGLIKVGSGLGIDGSGVLSRGNGDASYSSKGVLRVTQDTGFDLTAGVLSGINATAILRGVVQVGTNIDVSAGVISVATATNSVLGVVDSADSTHLTIDGTGSIDVGSDVSLIDVNNTWSAGQAIGMSTLTYSASITPDFSTSNIFFVTLTGNTTINNPTNVVAGGKYVIVFLQDATGGRTAGFGANFNFAGSSTISSEASTYSVVSITADTTTSLLCELTTGFKE